MRPFATGGDGATHQRQQDSLLKNLPPLKRELVRLASGDQMQASTPSRELLSGAIDHRLEGLLWTRVAAGDEILDLRDRKQLVRRILSQRAFQDRVWEALDWVVGRARSLGIEVGAAKGVITQARFWDREGERVTTDLDIYVDPEAMGDLERLVSALDPKHPLLGTAALVARPTVQTVDLQAPNGVWIDLHTDILKWEIPTRRLDELWAASRWFTAPSGLVVRVPNDSLSLVLFALGLNRDRFRQLSGYVDIARALERGEIDWDWVRGFVETEGLEIPVYRTIEVVCTTLGMAAPPLPSLPRMRSAIWSAVWRPSTRLEGVRGLTRSRRKYFVIPWLARRRASEVVKWYARRVFPPRDTVLQYYYPDLRGPYLWRLLIGRAKDRLRWLRARRDRHPQSIASPFLDPGAGVESRSGTQDVSVVTVSYRSRANLVELLPLISDLPVVIADNSPGEEDLTSLARDRRGVVVVDMGGNTGFARAANAAAARAGTRYVAFVNPDARPAESTILELADALKRDRSLGAVGPALVDASGRPQTGAGGWEATYRRALVHALGLHRIMGRSGLWAVARGGEPIEVDWVAGACIVVRRDEFLAVGGFDETYFLYQEDVELGRRVRQLGFRCMLRPDLSVVHVGGGSSIGVSSVVSNHRAESMITYLKRYHSEREAKRLLAILVAGNLLRCGGYLLTARRSRLSDLWPQVRLWTRALRD